MRLYDVPADTYRQVLDEPLPDDAVDGMVRVDQRGYAPDVADELGDDYLDDQVLLFGERQQKADLRHQEYGFIDELVAETYDHPFIATYADSEPVRLAIDIAPNPTGYDIHADIASATAQDHIVEAQETKQQIRGLTSQQLRDTAYIEEIAAKADTALDRFGDLEHVTFDETIVEQAVPSFTFTMPDTAGYLFKDKTIMGTEPYAVFISEQREGLFDFPYTAVDATDEIDEVIENLHLRNEITVDTDAATTRMDDIMRDASGTEAEDDTDFYLSEEFKETGRKADELPQEYWVLQELVDDGDISITAPTDLAKLPHFTGETPAATALLTDLQALEDDAFRFASKNTADGNGEQYPSSWEQPQQLRELSDILDDYEEIEDAYDFDYETDNSFRDLFR